MHEVFAETLWTQCYYFEGETLDRASVGWVWLGTPRRALTVQLLSEILPMIWMRYLSIWVCQLSNTHLINILKVNHWLRLQWLETSASGFHNTIIVNKCVEMNKMYKKWDRYKFNSNPVRHSWGHEEELSQFWDQWNTLIFCCLSEKLSFLRPQSSKFRIF